MDPVPKKDPTSTQTFSSISHTQASSGSSSIDALNTMPFDVQEAILTCQKERRAQLEILKEFEPENPLANNVTCLESDLQMLKPMFQEFQIADPAKKNQKEGELLEKVDEILTKYKGIGLADEDLEFLFIKQGTLTDFECNLQIVLCKVFNQSSFEQQVHNFVKSNSSLILKQFEERGLLIPQGIKNAQELTIQIKPALGGFATKHNQGKAPLIINLSNKGESFTFVFKPRDAKIDKAVYNAFQEINNHDERKLPSCIVLNPTINSGWENLLEIGQCSLWEYKDGKQFSQTDFRDVGTFIERRKEMVQQVEKAFKAFTKKNPQETLRILEQNETQFHKLTFDHHKDLFEKIKGKLQEIIERINSEGKVGENSTMLARELFPDIKTLSNHFKEETDSLNDQAVHLDSVLTQMKIGDLIPQNFLFCRVEGRLSMVPIDLEVFPASRTSMGVPKADHQTSDVEKSLIEKFQAIIKDYPVRILPLATASMVSPAINSIYASRETLSRIIIQALEKKYQLEVNETKMSELVLVDILNKDVPYCTLFQGVLFYGPHNKGIKIGQLKTN